MSRQDEQLARLQREADRASQQREQEGLATIAGTDSSGRILIRQAGEIRPLDAYHSNAGGQLGQAIEVSGGIGAIAPRSKPKHGESPPKPTVAWWVVVREETPSEIHYWLGGHNAPPVHLFSAPQQIPGCPSSVFVVAHHERIGPSYQLVYLGPSPSHTLPPVPQNGIAAVLIYCSTNWPAFNRSPGILGSGSPGPGPFTVTATPTTPGITPVDIDVSDNYYQPTTTISLDTAQGTIQVAATVRFRFGNMLHHIPPYGFFYLSSGGYYLEYFGFQNRISVSTISANNAAAPSSGIIQSYPLPNPDRGSGATINFAIKDRIPFVKLSHSPDCANSGPAVVLVRNYSEPVDFPSFSFRPDQPIGTEAVFFTGFPFLNLAQGASTAASINKWQRTAPEEPLPSAPMQVFAGSLLNKWEWPPGATIVAGGAVF